MMLTRIQASTFPRLRIDTHDSRNGYVQLDEHDKRLLGKEPGFSKNSLAILLLEDVAEEIVHKIFSSRSRRGLIGMRPRVLFMALERINIFKISSTLES